MKEQLFTAKRPEHRQWEGKDRTIVHWETEDEQ
jgi:hypothetical protein